MKFFEYQTPIDLSSPFNFLRSILINLVFAPFKLVVEIGRKIVFLPRVAIDRFLLSSIIISIIHTVIQVLVLLYRNSFSLWFGKFPIILSLAATVCLIILYFIFNSMSFVIYEHLDKMYATGILKDAHSTIDAAPIHSEEKDREKMADEQDREADDCIIKDDSVVEEKLLHKINEQNVPYRDDLGGDAIPDVTATANKPLEQASTVVENDNIFVEDNSFQDALKQLDETNALEDIYSDVQDEDFDFCAKPNNDVIDSAEIRDFQNRIRDGIQKLDTYGEKCIKFSEDEIARLNSELEGVTDPSKFIDDSLIEMFKQESLTDQAMQILSDLDIDVIPSDFTLLS